MLVRFFTDRHPKQDLGGPIFWNIEADASALKLRPDTKRVWITVEMPEDKELWPESFKGAEAEVVGAEISIGVARKYDAEKVEAIASLKTVKVMPGVDGVVVEGAVLK